MNNKPVLAFDCSGSGASIALKTQGGIFARTLTQGSQAGGLVSEIDGLMQGAGVSYAALGCITTTIGPGSFTGLRIGLAALHGLVLVHRTPIRVLTAMEAMAWQIALRTNTPAQFFIAMKVGKGELATQEFRVSEGKPIAHGDILRVAESNANWSMPCFGNHASPETSNYLAGVDAATLCDISPQLPFASLDQALPLYIRPPDAIIPKPHAWLAT